MAAPITAHSTTQITECVGGITHMFPNPKLKQLFFWTIELLALSLLVYIVSGFDFLMRPIQVFISTVFAPLVVAEKQT